MAIRFEGKTHDEIKESIVKWLNSKPMIALPGGTWCHLCNMELCRDFNTHSRQKLDIVMNILINELAEARNGKAI